MSDNNLFSFPEGSVGQAGGDICIHRTSSSLCTEF